MEVSSKGTRKHFGSPEPECPVGEAVGERRRRSRQPDVAFARVVIFGRETHVLAGQLPRHFQERLPQRLLVGPSPFTARCQPVAQRLAQRRPAEDDRALVAGAPCLLRPDAVNSVRRWREGEPPPLLQRAKITIVLVAMLRRVFIPAANLLEASACATALRSSAAVASAKAACKCPRPNRAAPARAAADAHPSIPRSAPGCK